MVPFLAFEVHLIVNGLPGLNRDIGAEKVMRL